MTTIKTSSLSTYSRVHNYLYNKGIECWGDLENLSISFFNLDREETDQLLKKTCQALPLDTSDTKFSRCLSDLPHPPRATCPPLSTRQVANRAHHQRGIRNAHLKGVGITDKTITDYGI